MVWVNPDDPSDRWSIAPYDGIRCSRPVRARLRGGSGRAFMFFRTLLFPPQWVGRPIHASLTPGPDPPFVTGYSPSLEVLSSRDILIVPGRRRWPGGRLSCCSSAVGVLLLGRGRGDGEAHPRKAVAGRCACSGAAIVNDGVLARGMIGASPAARARREASTRGHGLAPRRSSGRALEKSRAGIERPAPRC